MSHADSQKPLSFPHVALATREARVSVAGANHMAAAPHRRPRINEHSLLRDQVQKYGTSISRSVAEGDSVLRRLHDIGEQFLSDTHKVWDISHLSTICIHRGKDKLNGYIIKIDGAIDSHRIQPLEGLRRS